MHLYARYFNDKSPTPRGRRSVPTPTYPSPTKPLSITPTKVKKQSPVLQTSPGRLSIKLLSLVSRFEALDSLSQAPKNVSPKSTNSFYLQENSPIHHVTNNENIKRRLSPIHSGSRETLDGYHDGAAEFEGNEHEDIFGSSKRQAIDSTLFRVATREIQEVKSVKGGGSVRFHGLSKEPAADLFSKEENIIAGANPPTQFPFRSRANSIKDRINYFDGASSHGDGKQAIRSSTEPASPASRTFGLERTLIKRAGTNGIFRSRDTSDPSTPTKAQTATNRKKPWVLGSATSTRFLSRHSPKSPGISVSPYTSNKLKPRGIMLGSLFTRTSTRSEIKETADPSLGALPEGSLSEDRGRKRVAMRDNNPSSISLARKHLSSKIEELYRAKSLERKRAQDQEGAKHQETKSQAPGITTSPAKPVHVESPKRSSNQSPKRNQSRVANIKRLFEVGPSKTKSPPIVTKHQVGPVLLRSPRPVFNTGPFVDRGIAEISPRSPPIPPPLPQLGPHLTLMISPKTLPELPKADPTSPPHYLNPKKSPGAEDSPPQQPRGLRSSFKKQTPLRSKIVQDRMKAFESTQEMRVAQDSDKRLDIYVGKVRRSLQGMFENGPRNSREDEIPEGRGPSKLEIRQMVTVVQTTSESTNKTGDKIREETTTTTFPVESPKVLPDTVGRDSPTGSKRGKRNSMAGKRIQLPERLGTESNGRSDTSGSPTYSKTSPVSLRGKRGKRGAVVGMWNALPEPTEMREGEISDLVPGSPKRRGKRNTPVGRWNALPAADTGSPSGGDGTASIKENSSDSEEAVVMVVKEAECGLKQPKPLRVVEMKRIMLLCRERIGVTKEKDRARTSVQSTRL